MSGVHSETVCALHNGSDLFRSLCCCRIDSVKQSFYRKDQKFVLGKIEHSETINCVTAPPAGNRLYRYVYAAQTPAIKPLMYSCSSSEILYFPADLKS